MAAGAILAPGVLPRLDINRLRPSALLPAEDRSLLRDLLRRLLTPEGWAASDRLGLEAAALGRAALYGLDSETAVIATALDYAACALTVGEVVPDRLAEARRLVAGQGGALASGAEAAEEERARLAEARSATRRRMERESLALVGARAALAQRLEDAARELGRIPQRSAHHAVSAGLRHQLGALRARVVESRSRARLEELGELAGEMLGETAGVLAQVAEERRQAAEQVEMARRAEALEREQARQPALPAATVTAVPMSVPHVTRAQRRERSMAMVAQLRAARGTGRAKTPPSVPPAVQLWRRQVPDPVPACGKG